MAGIWYWKISPKATSDKFNISQVITITTPHDIFQYQIHTSHCLFSHHLAALSQYYELYSSKSFFKFYSMVFECSLDPWLWTRKDLVQVLSDRYSNIRACELQFQLVNLSMSALWWSLLFLLTRSSPVARGQRCLSTSITQHSGCKLFKKINHNSKMPEFFTMVE